MWVRVCFVFAGDSSAPVTTHFYFDTKKNELPSVSLLTNSMSTPWVLTLVIQPTVGTVPGVAPLLPGAFTTAEQLRKRNM